MAKASEMSPKVRHLLVCEQKMMALLENNDREAAHAEADRLLCRALLLLGCKPLVELYEQVDKWYA